jgi:hypothetical protein
MTLSDVTQQVAEAEGGRHDEDHRPEPLESLARPEELDERKSQQRPEDSGDRIRDDDP